MKSYSAYFVPAARRDAAARAFGSGRLLARVDLISGSDWAVCGHRDDAAPPDDAVLRGPASLTKDRSKELGELIYLFADTRPDSFVYEHAKAGVIVRKLVWFELLHDGTAGWTCVEGAPEPWEAAVFGSDPIVAMKSTPSCDGTVALAVELSLGLNRFGQRPPTLPP